MVQLFGSEHNSTIWRYNAFVVKTTSKTDIDSPSFNSKRDKIINYPQNRSKTLNLNFWLGNDRRNVLPPTHNRCICLVEMYVCNHVPPFSFVLHPLLLVVKGYWYIYKKLGIGIECWLVRLGFSSCTNF